MRRTILIGLVVFGVFLAGVGVTAGVAYYLWPDRGPIARIQRAASARRVARDPDAERPAGARAKAAPRAGRAPREEKGPFPEGVEDLTPEEKLEYRKSYRDERLADMDARLDAYAAKAGWEPDLTEEIRALLIETTDGITAILEKVDVGQVEWDEQKEELRRYRYEQAAKVEDLLGGQFEPFVQGMNFTRFLGDASPRDKLETHLPEEGAQ